ncbi:AAA family ATPase [Neolewinella agarilytica]|uniref:AAA domain-containing protein n=1 Tax=Neolewinella agarilytica TaxID=478744 RepID=A0A1H9M0Q8_9BACT|nr:AAA family ATPase [Neolewinella agarilytica]SER17258.1 AAA domain-containing protein [Neolewinella agarilytica]
MATRILIIGCSGSGKSTLARQLSERTGLPAIHLDQHYFGPDWKEPTTEAWIETVKALAARDEWIMDGNYSGTFPYRMPRADTVVYVDQPTWRCLYRVIKRTLRYWHRVRPGSAPGCRERFDRHFLHYVAVYNLTRRPGILKTLEEQRKAGKAVFHLSGSAAVRRFLNTQPGPRL